MSGGRPPIDGRGTPIRQMIARLRRLSMARFETVQNGAAVLQTRLENAPRGELQTPAAENVAREQLNKLRLDARELEDCITWLDKLNKIYG